MNLHEKTLELNITHELLNLADSFDWQLSNITSIGFWKTSHNYSRRSFFKKSIAYGLHSSIEGLKDDTGEAGGGYDVKIKSGANESVVFIQYKKGVFSKKKPKNNKNGNKSIFNVSNTKYFKFKLNSTKSNQHFTLRKLSNNITKKPANAVVYAFPLIKDIIDLEKNAGKIIRQTKFVSILDIDNESNDKKHPFKFGKSHSYRICAKDRNITEMNYYYYYYGGLDSSIGIICDVIILGIRKSINNLLNNPTEKEFIKEHEKILELTIDSYKKYILKYFEVPAYLEDNKYIIEKNKEIYPDSLTSSTDKAVVEIVFDYLDSISLWSKNLESIIPEYKAFNFTQNIKLNIDYKTKALHNTNMIKI